MPLLRSQKNQFSKAEKHPPLVVFNSNYLCGLLYCGTKRFKVHGGLRLTCLRFLYQGLYPGRILDVFLQITEC